MQHLVLALALLSSAGLSYVFFRKFNAGMVVSTFALGVAFNFGFSEMMKSRNFTDTEYVGYVAMRVEYYEDWDEWIDETCTDDNGQEYDCSYSEYHSSYWAMVDNGGFSYRITHSEYNDIVNFVHGMPVFEELNRDYYTNDGDRYYVAIPHEKLVVPITRMREYENRILPNQSLYQYSIVSDSEKDSLGLFDYPEIVHYSPHPYPNPFPKSVCTYQPATAGWTNEAFTIRMNVINALCGERLRTFIFFYPDRERKIAQKQIDRLQLGNFNELIVMLGLKDGKITWCETHSWEDVPTLRTAVKQWFTVNNNMDALMNFPDWYTKQIEAGLWSLKDYHDFDYIRMNFSLAQLAWLSVAQIGFQLFAYLYIIFLLRPFKTARKMMANGIDEECVKHRIDGMKRELNGYSAIMIMSAISLVSFIPSIMSFGLMASLKSAMVIPVIFCIIGILGIPLCMSRIIVIKRLSGKKINR
jgi:hypothetical protein